ncbi:MAG: transglycosylase SLT domain-containing protein [Segniliparus sp.]|uniref:transglycosylase SLT domain-containing protein n=1 Tax=Segniliparus sp. TaxID=2804064 RepID=UPI003F2CAF60
MGGTTTSQGNAAIGINDIEGLRSAGKQLVSIGTDVASIQQQVKLGEEVAQGMPNSAIAAAAPTAADAFKATLDATSKWPTDVGGKLLDAVSAVTGQDERAAAGIKQADGQGDQGAGAESGKKTGAGETAEGKIDVGKVGYDKVSAGTSEADMRNYINQALDKKGITDPAARKRWTDGYLTLMQRESSYNANAVNTSDSNANGAAVGDGNPANCSRGLAQCIPSTFAAYHQAGTSSNIYDPVANIAASMNYAQSRYGVSADGSNLASSIPQANPNNGPQGY